MNERHERARYKERFVLSNALLTVKQTIRRTSYHYFCLLRCAKFKQVPYLISLIFHRGFGVLGFWGFGEIQT